MLTKEDAIARVIQAEHRLARECEEAPEALWHSRPAANHWSMADVCEHVTLSHDNLYKLLSARVLETRIATGATDVADDEMPFLFYRGEEPPNIAVPIGRWPAKADGIAAFRASVKPFISWAEAANIDLRGHGASHPIFGMLDGVQWLLFTAAHMERHRAQIIGLLRAAAPNSRV